MHKVFVFGTSWVDQSCINNTTHLNRSCRRFDTDLLSIDSQAPSGDEIRLCTNRIGMYSLHKLSSYWLLFFFLLGDSYRVGVILALKRNLTLVPLFCPSQKHQSSFCNVAERQVAVVFGMRCLFIVIGLHLSHLLAAR